MQEENKVKKSFHQNMKSELKKVVWPTGKQVVKSTFATIGFVLLISIVLIALNYTFSFINTKWYDLVLKNDTENNLKDNEIINVSGDIGNSGDEIIVEDTVDESIESGSESESNVENEVTEELENPVVEDENTVIE